MIIVTGASGGIGRALCGALAKDEEVVGLYNTRPPEGEFSSGACMARLDLTDATGIREFVRSRAADLNHITVVHCAARSIDRLVTQCREDEWDEVMNVNLKGDFLLTKAVLPRMVNERWGRIIHLSSIIGMHGTVGTAAYAASKSALTGFSRVLAKEYGRFGVTSNVLCLGYFEVGLIETLDSDAKEQILARVPSRRFGGIADIAETVRWLVRAGYVNGAVINIDGGI